MAEMTVNKAFVARSKGGRNGGTIFYATIDGRPTREVPTWKLTINRMLLNGGFDKVFEADFDSLWHATNAMQKWRKKLDWRPV